MAACVARTAAGPPSAAAARAFVLDTRDLVMTDLNTLVTLPAGVVLSDAVAINTSGQIAAEGSDGHAYLLTPR